MKIKPAVHYLLTALWGLLTPVLMVWGSLSVLEWSTPQTERMGHSTPVEFLLIFAVIGLLCLGAYLLYGIVCAIFWLPDDGKRLRRFFLGLLLYVLIPVVGCLLLMFLGRGIM